MKKFIRYIYEYRNGKRIQNVGFVKVEMTGSMTVIQICGKGFPATLRKPLEIFLFYLEEDSCIGIPVGQMHVERTLANHRIEAECMKNEICGVILCGEQHGTKTYYAAMWEELQVDVEHMQMKPVERHLEIEAEQEVEVEPEPERAVGFAAETMKESGIKPEESQEETAKGVTVYKITRKDLVGLPRKEWKLANNHFLMHGCRNYHHLVSFEKDGAYWLGIPGIYHPNEANVAEAFGFGEFMKPDEGDVTLEDNEYTDQGEFGYWCRKVSSILRKNVTAGE